MFTFKSPRLSIWLAVSAVLFLAALALQAYAPGSLLAVSIYKAHLLSAGGWMGYWLDRALFPYSRPHTYFDEAEDLLDHGSPETAGDDGLITGLALNTIDSAGYAMIRRAIIVFACLIGICLGA